MTSEEKRIKDIAIEEMANLIREKSQATGVLVILDYANEDTQIVGCNRLEKEQAIELLKYWYGYLIKLRKLFEKKRRKSINLKEMAELVREKSQAMGAVVILDYGNEGTQIGCSNRLEKEQAIELLKYWSDALIKGLESE